MSAKKLRSQNRARAVGRMVLLALAAIPLIALAQDSKTAEDLPSGAMQGRVTAACTQCHEARIILQQRLSKAAWSKEVDKMVKWGAVVDASDRDALIDYLSTNFGPDQPQYQPPRSAELAGKKSK